MFDYLLWMMTVLLVATPMAMLVARVVPCGKRVGRWRVIGLAFWLVVAGAAVMFVGRHLLPDTRSTVAMAAAFGVFVGGTVGLRAHLFGD